MLLGCYHKSSSVAHAVMAPEGFVGASVLATEVCCGQGMGGQEHFRVYRGKAEVGRGGSEVNLSCTRFYSFFPRPPLTLFISVAIIGPRRPIGDQAACPGGGDKTT